MEISDEKMKAMQAVIDAAKPIASAEGFDMPRLQAAIANLAAFDAPPDRGMEVARQIVEYRPEASGHEQYRLRHLDIETTWVSRSFGGDAARKIIASVVNAERADAFKAGQREQFEKMVAWIQGRGWLVCADEIRDLDPDKS